MTPELSPMLELRCDDVHPVRCAVTLHAMSREELANRMCAHGATHHGFTPGWYHPARVAAIARACAD
jgi:hypothetical protein